MTVNPDGDDLVTTIMAALQADNQYVEHVDGEDLDRIAAIRSAGRRAGRRLSWKVRTFHSDPDLREDGKAVVIVAVMESTPLRDQLRGMRSGRRMRRAIQNWPRP